jgi:hypothetical protein
LALGDRNLVTGDQEIRPFRADDRAAVISLWRDIFPAAQLGMIRI